MKTLGIIFGIAGFIWASLTFADNVPQRVKSLGEVPGVTKNKDGRSQYRNQMNGNPRPDGLGAQLPAGLTAKDIVALLTTVRSASLATLVGAKPWPYRPNSYVAIACMAENTKEYERYKKSNQEPSCDYSNGGGLVFLGVIEYKPGQTKPALIASYGRPLDVTTNWEFTNLKGPDGEDDLSPQDYIRFDFAPFKISGNETAFGVRVGWNEGWAGGRGYYEALTLFTIRGQQLINVLSQPIYYYQDAGKRDHEFYEGQNVLAVLPGKTNGYYDLRISSDDKKWKRVFIWNKNEQRYVPKLVNPD